MPVFKFSLEVTSVRIFPGNRGVAKFAWMKRSSEIWTYKPPAGCRGREPGFGTGEKPPEAKFKI